MSDSENKSSRKKELTRAELQELAEDIVAALGGKEQTEALDRFDGIAPSDRRRVLGLINSLRVVNQGKVLRLSRSALSGGVAKKHEVALSAVLRFCHLARGADPDIRLIVRQLLIDLLDPEVLRPKFDLPHLSELDRAQVATMPGTAEALCELVLDAERQAMMTKTVNQWAALLGGILVDRSAAKAVQPEVARTLLGLVESIPLVARPVELRLAEAWINRIAGDSTASVDAVGRKVEDPPGVPPGIAVPTGATEVEAGPGRDQVRDDDELGGAFDQIRKFVNRLKSESDERTKTLDERITKLATALQKETKLSENLESQACLAQEALVSVRAEVTELRSDLERVRLAREADLQELENLRRELEMMQGMTESRIDSARTEVKTQFVTFALPSLRTVRSFAQQLRAGSTLPNPEVLAVPVSNLIKALHHQGFISEAELPPL